jgi:hypothetical protein
MLCVFRRYPLLWQEKGAKHRRFIRMEMILYINNCFIEKNYLINIIVQSHIV